MTSKRWLMLIVLSPLLAPVAAHSAPLPPSDNSPKPTTPVPPKDPPKPTSGAPGTGLDGPPIGTLFEYVTPFDFHHVRGTDTLAARSFDNISWVLQWAGRSSQGYVNGNRAAGFAVARVRLPRGAKIRWFDCALQSVVATNNPDLETIPGWLPATLTVTASLFHTRYTDHPKTAPPHTLATLKLTRKSLEGDNALQLNRGAAIDHPRATVADDGWYHVTVDMDLYGFDNYLGLRACRIGYLL